MPAAIQRQAQKGTDTDIDRLRSTIRDRQTGKRKQTETYRQAGQDRQKNAIRHIQVWTGNGTHREKSKDDVDRHSKQTGKN